MRCRGGVCTTGRVMGVTHQARVNGLAPWAGGRVQTPVTLPFIPRAQPAPVTLDYSAASGPGDHVFNPHVARAGSVIPASFSRIKARLLLPGELTRALVTTPDLLLHFFPQTSHIFSLSFLYKLTSSSLLATRNIRARISFHRLSVQVEYSVDPHCLSSKAGESALLR